MKTEDKKIAVIGIGGVGGYVAGMLAKAYPHVTMVARGARGESIRENGLVLHSDYKGEIVAKPERVVPVREMGQQDYIFICVKNYSLEDVCENIRDMVTDDTVIIPVMNGVDPAEKIRSLIGSAPSAAEQAPWKALMPETAANLLEKEMEMGKSPVLSEHFDQTVLAALRFLGAEGLRSCPFVAEGLEYKIYSAACSATSFETLIRTCTSLRYTASRIRRIVFAAILGITREMIKMPAPYIRILGMNRGCGPLMDALTECACVPVITSKAKFLKSAADLPETAPAKLFLRTENRAAELYALGYPARDQRIGCSELTHPLIYVSLP